jgi:NAD(P)-dependent dehydrogenase (short-subunit alcohol dehydrogenase family)
VAEGMRRLALVTGGHRRLGGFISAGLARAGWDVAIHGSSDADPDDALLQALDQSGAQWHGFIADFRSGAAVTGLMPAVSAHFGRAPELLVNSASLFGQDSLKTVDHATLMDHYAVNTAAPALLTQAFADAGPGLGNRCIINMLDQRLSQPHGDQLAYTLAKMALAGLTQVTARVLAPDIRVNAVAPGLTLATGDYNEALMARLSAMMPLERLPDAASIVDAILYLVDARNVTGQTITVDGGAHMISYARDFMHL